ncbi:hypothetical protein P7C70_g1518, partial [Phenoliferia sp. Uapishka_3]
MIRISLWYHTQSDIESRFDNFTLISISNSNVVMLHPIWLLRPLAGVFDLLTGVSTKRPASRPPLSQLDQHSHPHDSKEVLARSFKSIKTTPPPSTPLGRPVPSNLDGTPTRPNSAPPPESPVTPQAQTSHRVSAPSTLSTLVESPDEPPPPPPNSRPTTPESNSSLSSPLTSPLDTAPHDDSDDESMPSGHEEDRLAAIGPVNAGNWKEWREAFQGCLEMLGFDKSMEEVKPEEPASAGRYSTEMVNYRRALKDWTKDTASTIDLLRRHTGAVNKVYLTKDDTPTVWLSNLKTVYDVENVMDGAFLVEAFFANKYTGGSLTEWLSQFAELAEKINLCYEASIPPGNKRAIFDRLLRDSIIIRIGADWRKELGDVKPSATTADVVGVLTRKYDFHVAGEKRDENHALVVSSAVANAALVITPSPSTKPNSNPRKKPDAGNTKSKLERALDGVKGAICKLFVGWIKWPGGISASGRFLVGKGMCYRCMEYGHVAGDCTLTNDNAAQQANQIAVLLHYGITMPSDSFRVRLRDVFCGDAWMGGKKGAHAVAGNGKWTRKPKAGKDGKITGAGENHGYIAGGEEDVYAAADSEDDETLFAGSLTFTETEIQAFDRVATAYHVDGKVGSFEDDDIWLTFGACAYVGGPHFGEEEGFDAMPGLDPESESSEDDGSEEEIEEGELPDLIAPVDEHHENFVRTAIATSHPAYPPFDVANAFTCCPHPTILSTAPLPPSTPRANGFAHGPAHNTETWADEIHAEIVRLGLQNTGRDFLFPVGLSEGDAVKVIWDSGANRHYWSLRQYLHDYVDFDSPRNIGGAFGSVGVAIGSGTLKVVFKLDDGTLNAVAIHDVYFVPGLGANLISAGQLFQQGVGCVASPARVTLTHADSAPFGYVDINANGTMLLRASFVRSSPTPSSRNSILPPDQALITYPADRNLWHRRLGHCGGGRLDQVLGMVDGLSFCNSTPLSPCIKCSQGKITRKSVRKVALRPATFNLERISVDVWGPSRVVGLGGARYIFAIVDQHSRYIFGFAQQLKSQSLPNLQSWTRRAERLQGRRLVGIRTDHGGETKSNAMTSWTDKEGYIHEFANVRSHDEHGLIERQFRTVLNMIRTSLLESGLPLFLWVECFLASVYVKNRLPTRGLTGPNAGKTPYEVWFGKRPDLSNLRVWGCEVVVHYSLELGKDKVTDRGWRGFMVGYSETSAAWRIYDPAKRMVFESPDVDFFENVFRTTPPSDERLAQLRLFDHDLPWSNAPLLEIPIPRPFELSWQARVEPRPSALSAPTPAPAAPTPTAATPVAAPPPSRIPRLSTPSTPTPSSPATPRLALYDTPSPSAPTPAPLGPRVRSKPDKWQPSGKKITLQARLVVETDNRFSALEFEDSSIGHLGGDSELVPSPPTVSPYVPTLSANINTSFSPSSRNFANLTESVDVAPPIDIPSRRERLAARVASTRADYDAALQQPFTKFSVKKLSKAHVALRTATRVEKEFISSSFSASPAILESITSTLNSDGQPVWSDSITNSLRLPGGGLGHNSSPPTVRPNIVSPALEPQDDALLASSEIDLEALLHELLPSLPDPTDPLLSGAQLSVDDALDYTVYAVQTDFSGESCPITDLHSYNAWSGSVDEPTFSQAMRGPDRDQWLAAVHKELAMLRAMGTWDPSPVSLPAQRRALLSKWVLLIKRDDEGRVIKYKARLVARGDMQTEGLDYTETFAATVRQSSVRAIIALAAQNGWALQQFDVSSAYLHGTLKEEVYLRQPPGFGDDSNPSGVLRLRKSLYGLCQAGHEWNNLLHSTLVSFGMERTGSDHGVYHIKKDGETLILAIHVDDGLVASSSPSLSKSLELFLQSKFDVDAFGAATIFLGLRITQDLVAGTVTVDQRGVTAGYVAEFLGLKVSPVSTPCDPKLHLVAATPAEAAALDPATPYRAAIGALLWLSLSTRPDIAFAVSVVGRYSASPGVAHWTAVKRIFRYLAGTPFYGLIYRKVDGETVGLFDAFSDADHAGDHDSRKSTSGFVVRMAGAAISWLARLQKSVSISTTEAEYMGLSACAMEVVWLRALFSELGFRQPGPTLIRGDNMGSISLAKHPTAHQRTKHIAIHYHFTRDKVATKEVVLRWIPTAEMVADVMTKGLDAGKHRGFSADCGLSDVLREGEC